MRERIRTMTEYVVTYSTRSNAPGEPSSVPIKVDADDVPSAIDVANARQRVNWPDWLLDQHFISAVVPLDKWNVGQL
jgi:hypothetical protein